MEPAELTDETFLQAMAADFPQCKITKSDLQYPKSEFVMTYYRTILDAVIEIEDLDNLWCLKENQLEYINSGQSDGSLFLQNVMSFNFFNTLRTIFEEITANDVFTYNDLLCPEVTPLRTKTFMLMMFSFYLSYCQLADGLEEIMEIGDKKLKEKKDLEEKKEKLIDQLNKNAEGRLYRNEKLKNIKASIAKHLSIIEEDQNLIKDLESDHGSVEQSLLKVADEEQYYQNVLTKLENDKKYYEGLLVSDQNYSKLVVEKDECVKKMNILKSKVDSTSAQLTQLSRVIDLQHKFNTILKDEKYSGEAKQIDFKHLHDSIKILNENLTSRNDNNELFVVKIKEAEEVFEKCNIRLNDVKSEQTSSMMENSEKIKNYLNTIEDQKKTFSQLSYLVRRDESDIEEAKATLEKLNQECEEIVKKIKAIDCETKEKYLELENALTEMLSSIPETSGAEL